MPRDSPGLTRRDGPASPSDVPTPPDGGRSSDRTSSHGRERDGTATDRSSASAGGQDASQRARPWYDRSPDPEPDPRTEPGLDPAPASTRPAATPPAPPAAASARRPSVGGPLPSGPLVPPQASPPGANGAPPVTDTAWRSGPPTAVTPSSDDTARVDVVTPDRPIDQSMDPAPDLPDVPSDTSRGRRSAVRRRARRVTRIVRRIDLWSVLKLALIVYTCVYVASMMAFAVVWGVAYSTGLIDKVQSFLGDVGLENFRFYGDQMFRAAAAIGAVMVLAGTLITVLSVALVNLISEMTGGIRVIVIEEDPVASAPRDVDDTAPAPQPEAGGMPLARPVGQPLPSDPAAGL